MEGTGLLISFMNILPELTLGLWCLLLLPVGALVGRRFPQSGWLVPAFALSGFVLAGVLLFGQASLLAAGEAGGRWEDSFGAEWLFKGAAQPYGFGMVVVDGMALFFKALIAVVAVLAIAFTMAGAVRANGPAALGRRYALVAAMGLGMFLMCGANDLVLAVLAAELVSLSAYMLAGSESSPRSAEASMKFAVYGLAATGTMLVGVSILYGLFGTTNFGELSVHLGAPNTENALRNPLVLASVLTFVGLASKLGVAPFHFWAPDVHEGAPIDLNMFVVAMKAAALVVLVRFIVVYPVAMQGFDWTPALAAVAALSMSLGNLAALQQTNLKRLLAYSSIVHAGFMIAAVAAGTAPGIAAVMVYAAVYSAMMLGALFATQKIAENLGSEEVEDLRGLVSRSKPLAVMLAIFMAALVGLPPTGGFIGKMFVFDALIEARRGFGWLIVVGALNAVVAAYYHLRVVRAVFLDAAAQETPARFQLGRFAALALGLLAAITVLLGIPPLFVPLVDAATEALKGVLPLLREPFQALR